jgi:hypothetical protein
MTIIKKMASYNYDAIFNNDSILSTTRGPVRS